MAAARLDRIFQCIRLAVPDDPVSTSDGQLLERFLATREEACFEVLLRRHGRMVLGVCRRVLQNSDDAEDAFQATFLVLVRKAVSLLARQTIGDWLYGVAYHTSLKARAANLRRRDQERRASIMPNECPPAQDLWRELQPLLDRELNRLPAKYRRPVVLCDLEGKTRKEAAQQLGWPEGTVSGRLSRARALLAKRLTRQGLALSAAALAAHLTSDAASASLPPALVGATAKFAAALAAGQATAAGTVGALADGVSRSMALTKLKTAAAVLLASLAVGSAGVLTWQALAGSEPPATLAQKNTAVPPVPAPEAGAADVPNLPPELAAKLPEAVRDAVLARFPGARLIDVEQDDEDGTPLFSVAIKHQGQDIEVAVTRDATITLIERVITARDLPPAVAQALEAAYPRARFRKIEEAVKVVNQKETLDRYEIVLVTARKKTLAVSVSADGKIVKQDK